MKFVNVAQASQVVPGKAIRVEIGDESVAIFNVDGDLYAIGDTCIARDGIRRFFQLRHLRRMPAPRC